MDDSLLYKKAFSLAVETVKLYKELSHKGVERALTKQLLRSDTSIAANIAEALGSFSRKEFAAKMSIAYKETRETKYWLNLLQESGDLGTERHRALFKEVDEIGGMLFTTVRKSKS